MQPDDLNNWWENDKQRTHIQNYRSAKELDTLVPQRNWLLMTSRALQQAAIYSFLLITFSGC